MLALLAAPPALAILGEARLPRWSAAISAVAMVGSAAVLVVGGMSGFCRGALLLSLVGVGISLLAFPSGHPGPSWAPWLAHLLAVLVVTLSRVPIGLLLALLLLAATLPRLGPPAGREAWRRSLVIGGTLLFAATVANQVEPRPATDLAIAGILVLGLLAMLGAIPSGVGLMLWLRQAGARLAVAATVSVVPALVAVAADSVPLLGRLHLAQATRPGVTLAIFGAATVLAAALYALAAPRWREQAAAGVVADVGLALVAIGALALGAAALTLTLMVLTRPAMYLLGTGRLHGRLARLGAIAATLGASGMPPTLGFAARLLVLAAALRLGLPLALAVLAGVVLLAAAALRAILASDVRGGSEPGRPVPRRAAMALALAGVLSVAGGAFPGVLLARLWQLGP